MATIACSTPSMDLISDRTFRLTRLLALTLVVLLGALSFFPLNAVSQTTLGRQLTVYSGPVVYANPMYDSVALV